MTTDDELRRNLAQQRASIAELRARLELAEQIAQAAAMWAAHSERLAALLREWDSE